MRDLYYYNRSMMMICIFEKYSQSPEKWLLLWWCRWDSWGKYILYMCSGPYNVEVNPEYRPFLRFVSFIEATQTHTKIHHGALKTLPTLTKQAKLQIRLVFTSLFIFNEPPWRFCFCKTFPEHRKVTFIFMTSRKSKEQVGICKRGPAQKH